MSGGDKDRGAFWRFLRISSLCAFVLGVMWAQLPAWYSPLVAAAMVGAGLTMIPWYQIEKVRALNTDTDRPGGGA